MNKWVAAAGVVGALSLGESGAFANTITFGTSGSGDFTAPITEDGFTYSIESGYLLINQFGNPDNDMEGTQSVGGGVLEIIAAGGGDFTFNSLDFAAWALSGTGSQILTVAGLVDGAVVDTASYTLTNTSIYSPSFKNWTTENASGSTLDGLTIDELEITLQASSGTDSADNSTEAIDNVVLTPLASPVPEPASLVLFGTSLLGLGLIGGRQRRA